MGGKHAAVYVRVSSKVQDEASQLPELKRWAKAQEVPVRWYRDTFTGTTMDRPGFSKLVEECKAGRVQTVAVWRLDRLGRTASGLTALFDQLRALKVNLVSLRDGLDLSTPAGRLLANVVASVAAYETEVRGERSLAGQAAARARGVKFGLPPGPRPAYKATNAKRATIRAMKAEGHKVTVIARAVELSRDTVYKVLADGA